MTTDRDCQKLRMEIQRVEFEDSALKLFSVAHDVQIAAKAFGAYLSQAAEGSDRRYLFAIPSNSR